MKQNVFKSLDPKTGRPDVDPARQPGTGKEAEFCPSHWGGKNWPPIAFSPKTRMIYIPANENLCSTIIGRPVTYTAGRSLHRRDHDAAVGAGRRSHRRSAGVERRHRQAGVDAQLRPRPSNWGPMLATGGGLVFSGGTNDRMFRAFDASSGALLWEFPTNSGIIGQPSSFAVDGRQYIAVQSGWGIDARAMQGPERSPGDFRKCPRAARSGCLRSSRSGARRLSERSRVAGARRLVASVSESR